jgi:membrane protease YdiL (CAAX protease family)
MTSLQILAGFVILFLLYQLAEANGQGLLRLPGQPYSIFILFLLVIPAAAIVARWQGQTGLASYGMGLDPGWWQYYLSGLGLGFIVQAGLEWSGTRLGIRCVSNVRFSWRTFLAGILWVVFTNFPAAAGEDLVTRGYPWRFMQPYPLLVFLTVSTLLYTFNHIIRLLTHPATNWIHLPVLGLTLAYALYTTGSLWYAIGLHQSGNITYSLMQRMMDVSNIASPRKRMAFSVLSEGILLMIVIILTPLVRSILGTAA